MKILPLILLIAGVALLYFAFKPTHAVEHREQVTICSWNMKVFGITKSSNIQLMDSYVQKIKKCDIFFIQEIRDETGESFEKLCRLLKDYNCYNSSRAGDSISKEQYGVFWKKKIKEPKFIDYNNFNLSFFERPPLYSEFILAGNTIGIYYIHTKPEDTESEIDSLERMVTDRGFVIIMGDLNMDCNYYHKTNFKNYVSLINSDTTVAATNCSYDKIFINSNLKNYINSTTIDSNITLDMSDHYIIGTKLNFLV